MNPSLRLFLIFSVISFSTACSQGGSSSGQTLDSLVGQSASEGGATFPPEIDVDSPNGNGAPPPAETPISESPSETDAESPSNPEPEPWQICDFDLGLNASNGMDAVVLDENTQELFGDEYPLACDEDTSEADTYGIKDNIVVNLKLCSRNLIKNPFFKHEDDHQALGISAWEFEHIYGSSAPFSLLNDEHSFFRSNYIQIKGNAAGVHFITQAVSVQANKHYTINALYELTTNDYRQAGIFIYKGNDLIAQKTSSVVTQKAELLSYTFTSDSDQEISIKLGFDNGINSEFKIYYVEMTETDNSSVGINYDTTPKQFVESCVAWNSSQLSNSIAKVTDYTLSVLGNPDANSRAFFKQQHSKYLTNWLSSFIDYYTINSHLSSFCQAASLSAAEITSLFDVRTRQWHWTGIDGIGQHQFFEYFDTAMNKWVVADPYYSIQYSSNGVLLGVSEIVQLGIENVEIVNMQSRFIFPVDTAAIYQYFSEGTLQLGLSY